MLNYRNIKSTVVAATFSASGLLLSAAAVAQQDSQENDAAVVVDERAAQVEVNQDAPKVTAEQQRMKVKVRSGEPEVDVQTQEPEVSVNQQKPEISIDQAEPKVVVQEAKPQVEVNQAEPEVTVKSAEPQVEIITQDAEGDRKDEQNLQAQEESSAQQQNREEQGLITEQTERPEPQVSERVSQTEQNQTMSSGESADELMQTDLSQLQGMAVITADGQELGSIEDIVANSDTGEVGFVVPVGGFFGFGDTKLFVPAQDAQLQNDQIVWGVSQAPEELKESAEYQQSQHVSVADRYNTLQDANQSAVAAE